MSSEQQLEALISDQEKPCRAAFYHVLLRNAEERLRCQVESDFNVYFPVSASVAPFSHLKDESSVRSCMIEACKSDYICDLLCTLHTGEDGVVYDPLSDVYNHVEQIVQGRVATAAAEAAAAEKKKRDAEAAAAAAAAQAAAAAAAAAEAAAAAAAEKEKKDAEAAAAKLAAGQTAAAGLVNGGSAGIVQQVSSILEEFENFDNPSFVDSAAAAAAAQVSVAGTKNGESAGKTQQLTGILKAFESFD